MVGQAGSATRVIKIFFPKRVRSGELLQGDLESQIEGLIARLKNARLV